MEFREAYLIMKEGKKIRLPEWKGYWCWENNTIMIYCGDGTILDIRDTNDVDYTFTFICRNEWQIVEEV